MFELSDRRALQSVAVQFFVNGALFASFIPRLPEVRDDVDITVGTLGLLLAAASLCGIIGSVLVGPVVERFGTRRVMIGAASGLVLALPVIGFATLPIVLMLGLIAMSTLDVLVDSAMNMQGSWLSARRHAPVMNRLHGLWSLGTVIGGVGAARLASAQVPLRTHLVGVSVTMAAVLVFVGRGLLRKDEHDGHAAEPTATTASRPNRAWVGLLLFGVVAGCSIAMEMTSSDWAAFRLSDDLGASAGLAGLGYVAFTAGMTSGRFGGDWAVVHFGPTRVFRAGLVLAGLGLSIAAFVPDTAAVLGGYLLAGLGVATQFPKLYDDAVKFPGRPGLGLGALTGGSKIALVIAPLLVGGLANSSLSVGTAIAAMTLPALALFVLTSAAIARRAATA